VAALGAAAMGGYWWLSARGAASPVYRTAVVATGNIAVTVSATGTLQPVNQVQVGAEFSGTVRAVLVDYNDRVTKGQVLARFDTTKLAAQLEHMHAAVDAARASAAVAAVTAAEEERDLARAKSLASVVRGTDLEAAQAIADRARAALDVARAQVRLAEADLAATEAELGKAEVRSPINGIVLKRGVEPGQTVAATLQAPVLFTLAEDLTQLDLLVDIDEADAAQVAAGQQGTFTVEAFPGRQFDTRVVLMRYLPETQAGVVTYKARLAVANPDVALLPGMTATVDISIGEFRDILLVPNAAFRFAPPAETASRGGFGGLFAQRSAETPAVAAGTKAVWVLRNEKPEAIAVRVGVSNDTYTEVLPGELAAGTPVILEARPAP
jgi:HlyD family secretion protein